MFEGRYTRPAIWLHWLIAAGVIVNILLAWTWPFGDSYPALGEYVRPMIDKHKAIGVTVLGLVILRWLWRLTHKPPPFPAGYRRWETVGAHIVHWSLYVVLLAMPLTGWIMDSAYKDAALHPMSYFGLFEWPRLGFIQHLPPERREHVHQLFGELHRLIAYVIYALFVIHVGGALKHQVEGHRELQRMGLGRA